MLTNTQKPQNPKTPKPHDDKPKIKVVRDIDLIIVEDSIVIHEFIAVFLAK